MLLYAELGEHGSEQRQRHARSLPGAIDAALQNMPVTEAGEVMHPDRWNPPSTPREGCRESFNTPGATIVSQHASCRDNAGTKHPLEEVEVLAISRETSDPELRSHLAMCPMCRAHELEAEELFHLMAYSAEPYAPPEGVKSRLLGRLAR